VGRFVVGIAGVGCGGGGDFGIVGDFGVAGGIVALDLRGRCRLRRCHCRVVGRLDVSGRLCGRGRGRVWGGGWGWGVGVGGGGGVGFVDVVGFGVDESGVKGVGVVVLLLGFLPRRTCLRLR